ncbi:MAG: exodeoxyribonuclease VII large subunit [Patescibacteria group bacterium]|nr:exodeoxyribonuclease VII large subunit [Patescibacteria group bacterium]MDE2438591.1 exodeoxyribonuclease VII large subunit [Patescibacteria group bacterium]
MNGEVFRQLMAWRNEKALHMRVERFKILQNKTIEMIAEEAPKTYDALADIKGIGKKKLAEFGNEILGIVNRYGGETGLQDLFSHQSSKTALSKEQEEQDKDAEKEPVFTVSNFLNFLNTKFSERTVCVQGEVSSVQVHPSGIYFSLKDKDDESVLNCYIRPSVYERCGVVLDEGMEIKMSGVPNVYKPKGRLSFLVYTLELAGEGSLKKAYELLKKKLEEEGLFARKRSLPEFIHRIGIVTSRTGAVIDDFRRNLMPLGMELYLCDARVEGVRAVDDVLAGIKWFNAYMPDLDVLVVIRGGGSLEDMQAFNNERVARALFASAIPTFCGIGHDRDVPIVNLVADRAASTPSIVAMAMNASWDRLRENLPTLRQDLLYSFESAMSGVRTNVDTLLEKLLGYIAQLFLRFRHLAHQLSRALDEIGARIESIRKQSNDMMASVLQSMSRVVRDMGTMLHARETYLEGVSPERNLKLGYSIIKNEKGKVVRSSSDVKIGERVTTKLGEGELVAKVEEVN